MSKLNTAIDCTSDKAKDWRFGVGSDRVHDFLVALADDVLNGRVTIDRVTTHQTAKGDEFATEVLVMKYSRSYPGS